MLIDMKNRKKSALLLLVVYSLVLMEIFGVWVKCTGQVIPPADYQPGITYACLYLRDLSIGAVEPPFSINRPDSEEMELADCGEQDLWEGVPEVESLPANENSESEESAEQELSDPMEQVSTFEPVSEDYFEDALFIGDSRIVGLSQYGNLDQADFAAEVGLTVFRLFDKKFLETENSRQKETIRDLLTQKQYKKIYLMIGINELGTGDEERFQGAYRSALQEIENLQPNAIIFVQGLMHVTEKKSKEEKFINNEHIDVRNAGLEKLADNKRVFYLDINPLYDDENRSLNVSYTGDGVHLKAQYYALWRDYLMQNGIVKHEES